MHEYQDDEQRADIFHEEQIDMEHIATESAPVGELVVNNLVRQIPAYEKTSEETTYGKARRRCDSGFPWYASCVP